MSCIYFLPENFRLHLAIMPMTIRNPFKKNVGLDITDENRRLGVASVYQQAGDTGARAVDIKAPTEFKLSGMSLSIFASPLSRNSNPMQKSTIAACFFRPLPPWRRPAFGPPDPMPPPPHLTTGASLMTPSPSTSRASLSIRTGAPLYVLIIATRILQSINRHARTSLATPQSLNPPTHDHA